MKTSNRSWVYTDDRTNHRVIKIKKERKISRNRTGRSHERAEYTHILPSSQVGEHENNIELQNRGDKLLSSMAPIQASQISSTSSPRKSDIINNGESNIIGDFCDYVIVNGVTNRLEGKNTNLIIIGRNNRAARGVRNSIIAGSSNHIESQVTNSSILGSEGLCRNHGEHVLGAPMVVDGTTKLGRAQSSHMQFCGIVDDRGICNLKNASNPDYLRGHLLFLPNRNSINWLRVSIVSKDFSGNNICCGTIDALVIVDDDGNAKWNPQQEHQEVPLDLTIKECTFANPPYFLGVGSSNRDNCISIKVCNNEGNGRLLILAEIDIQSLSN